MALKGITFDASLGVFDAETDMFHKTTYLGIFESMSELRTTYENKRSQEEPHMFVVFLGGSLLPDGSFAVGKESDEMLVRIVTA